MTKRSNIFIVFVSSQNPFPYINALTTAVKEFDSNTFVLVKITGFPSERPLNLLDFANNKIKNNLNELAEEINLKYFDKNGNNISNSQKKFDGYKLLLEHFGNRLKFEQVRYKLLKWDIKEILQKYSQEGEVIVDITGADKRAAIDIFMACTSIGIEKVGLFELRREIDRTKDKQFTMYHNLNDEDYEYPFMIQDVAFIESVQFLIAKRNRVYLLIVIGIILALTAVAFYYTYKFRGEDNTWIPQIILGLIAVFTGIYSIIGAWSTNDFKALIRKK